MLVEICLPVKDEAQILAANLQRILNFCQTEKFSFDYKIIGLINGSKDETLQIFSDFKNRYPSLVDYVEIKEPGKGRALREYWNTSQADILSYLDIDLAVLPDQLPELLQPLLKNNADLVIGSRLLASSLTNRSLTREISSRVFNLLARLILPNKVSDLQCGFKAMKATAFKKISPYLKDNYWLFDCELIIIAQHFSYRVQELAVNWDEQRYQKRVSKVNLGRDLLKFLKALFLLRFRLFFIPKP